MEEDLMKSLEKRFAGRPHVGTVTHVLAFNLLEVSYVVLWLIEDVGLTPEAAEFGTVMPRVVWNAVAKVPAVEEGELWVFGVEHPAWGSEIRIQVYHQLDQSAPADEWLAMFVSRLTTEFEGARPPKGT